MFINDFSWLDELFFYRAVDRQWKRCVHFGENSTRVALERSRFILLIRRQSLGTGKSNTAILGSGKNETCPRPFMLNTGRTLPREYLEQMKGKR